MSNVPQKPKGVKPVADAARARDATPGEPRAHSINVNLPYRYDERLMRKPPALASRQTVEGPNRGGASDRSSGRPPWLTDRDRGWLVRQATVRLRHGESDEELKSNLRAEVEPLPDGWPNETVAGLIEMVVKAARGELPKAQDVVSRNAELKRFRLLALLEDGQLGPATWSQPPEAESRAGQRWADNKIIAPNNRVSDVAAAAKRQRRSNCQRNERQTAFSGQWRDSLGAIASQPAEGQPMAKPSALSDETEQCGAEASPGESGSEIEKEMKAIKARLVCSARRNEESGLDRETVGSASYRVGAEQRSRNAGASVRGYFAPSCEAGQWGPKINSGGTVASAAPDKTHQSNKAANKASGAKPTRRDNRAQNPVPPTTTSNSSESTDNPVTDDSADETVATETAHDNGDTSDPGGGVAASRIRAEVERLSKLDQPGYLAERKSVAKELNISVRELNCLVHEAHASKTRRLAEATPAWKPISSMHPDPVSGDLLLAELVTAIRRFVRLSDQDALIVALWALFTWVFEQCADTNPFLRLISPAPECGKSTLLKVLSRICRSSWMLARVTPAAFSRTVHSERRTLLLDEGDAFLADNEVMRNVLDSASDPDTAIVSVCFKQSDDWAPTQLNLYVPIAIASIGTLRRMQTVESRAIAVHLKRATAAERKTLLKGRRRELISLLDPIAAKCARWALDNAASLRNNRPQLPGDLSGREQDKWEPLVTIADAIGEAPGRKARQAAQDHCAALDPSDSLPGIRLLADLYRLFQAPQVDKLSSNEICQKLSASDDSPWFENGRAHRPITQHQLANLLRPFKITPKTIRLRGSTVTTKGYEKPDFEETWERYLA